MPNLLKFIETFGENRRSAIQTETNTSYTRVFYVEFDNEVINLQDVLDVPALPLIGASYIDSGTNATCRNREVVEIKGSRSQFYVIVTYDTLIDNNSGTIEENPMNDLWKIQVTSRDRAVAATKLFEWDEDLNAWTSTRPIRNKAGDEFEPTVTIQVNDTTITLIKNYSAVQWAFLDEVNKVNESAVTIWGKEFKKRNLFLDSLGISGYQERNGIGFYTHTFKIHHRLPILTTAKDFDVGGGGWDHNVPNYGYNQLTGSSVGTKARIFLSGSPCVKPQPLDVDGKFAADSEVHIQYQLPLFAYANFNFPIAPEE